MYRKKRFYLVCAFCMFVFAFSQSSAKAQATANINWLDTSEYPSMKAFVSVINTDGKPSVNLTENRFSVYIDGAKLTPDRVEVFAESGEKADIVLLVDNSGSMKGKLLESAKEGVLGYVDKLRQGKDRIAVMTFADEIELVSDFTNDFDAVKHDVRNIQPTGNYSVVFEAVVRGIQKAAQSKNTISGVILISDGHNEAKGYTIDDCIQEANKHRIPVSTIGFTKPRYKDYLGNLRKIAEKTNGFYLYAKSTDKLRETCSMAEEMLKNQYIVTFVSPHIKRDGSEHKVVVAAAGPRGPAASQRLAFNAPWHDEDIEPSSESPIIVVRDEVKKAPEMTKEEPNEATIVGTTGQEGSAEVDEKDNKVAKEKLPIPDIENKRSWIMENLVKLIILGFSLAGVIIAIALLMKRGNLEEDIVEEQPDPNKEAIPTTDSPSDGDPKNKAEAAKTNDEKADDSSE